MVPNGAIGRQPHCQVRQDHSDPLKDSLCFSLNSSTRASSGVMVAHLTPTEYLLDGLGGVEA